MSDSIRRKMDEAKRRASLVLMAAPSASTNAKKKSLSQYDVTTCQHPATTSQGRTNYSQQQQSAGEPAYQPVRRQPPPQNNNRRTSSSLKVPADDGLAPLRTTRKQTKKKKKKRGSTTTEHEQDNDRVDGTKRSVQPNGTSTSSSAPPPPPPSRGTTTRTRSPPPPLRRIASQAEQDERLKRKMAEADRIANRELGAGCSGNNQNRHRGVSSSSSGRLSQAETDERLKRKMAEADHIASIALGAGTPTVQGSNRSKKKPAVNDRDEQLKRKMAQADSVMGSLLLSSPQRQDGRDSHLKRKEEEAGHIAGSMLLSSGEPLLSRTSGAARAEPRTITPLQPQRRVSKQRYYSQQEDEMTPGAYAVTAFNASSSSQQDYFLPNDELTDRLALDDDNWDSQGEEEYDDDDDIEVFEDEHVQQQQQQPRGSGTSSSMSRSMVRSLSGRISAGSARLLNVLGMSNNNNEEEEDPRSPPVPTVIPENDILEADVSLAAGTRSSYNTTTTTTTTTTSRRRRRRRRKGPWQKFKSLKPKSRRRCILHVVVVLSLVVAFVATLAVLLSQKDRGGRNEAPQEPGMTPTATSTPPPAGAPTAVVTSVPTGMPTASPAPTVDGVTITVVIGFDSSSQETGWMLECDERLVKEMPYGTYFDKVEGDVISDTLYVQEGADCQFTILDSEGDGLCCEAGRGFYQVFLAGNDKEPNVVVAEGSQFGASETTNFIAISQGG